MLKISLSTTTTKKTLKTNSMNDHIGTLLTQQIEQTLTAITPDTLGISTPTDEGDIAARGTSKNRSVV